MPKTPTETPPASTAKLRDIFRHRGYDIKRGDKIANARYVDPRSDVAMEFLLCNIDVFLGVLTLLQERGEHPKKIWAADQHEVNILDQKLKPPAGQTLQFSSITILLNSALGVNCILSRRGGIDGFSAKFFILNEPSQVINLVEKLKKEVAEDSATLRKIEDAVKRSVLKGKTATDYPTQKEVEEMARKEAKAKPGAAAVATDPTSTTTSKAPRK